MELLTIWVGHQGLNYQECNPRTPFYYEKIDLLLIREVIIAYLRPTNFITLQTYCPGGYFFWGLRIFIFQNLAYEFCSAILDLKIHNLGLRILSYIF